MGGAGILQVKVEVEWSLKVLRSFCPDQLCELGECLPSLSFSFSFPSLDRVLDTTGPAGPEFGRYAGLKGMGNET